MTREELMREIEKGVVEYLDSLPYGLIKDYTDGLKSGFESGALFLADRLLKAEEEGSKYQRRMGEHIKAGDDLEKQCNQLKEQLVKAEGYSAFWGRASARLSNENAQLRARIEKLRESLDHISIVPDIKQCCMEIDNDTWLLSHYEELAREALNADKEV